MKLIKTLFILSVLIVSISCNKDEETPVEPEGFYMTAKIDQEDFNAKPETVLVDYYTDDGDFMTIRGKTNENRFITFIVNLQNYTQGSGTYAAQDVRFVFGIESQDGFITDLWNIDQTGIGTLTILEEDTNHLKGTFTFSPMTAYGDLTNYNSNILITKGKFNAKKS